MGFKMTIEVDVDSNPDAVGEALRSLFFDEPHDKDGRHGIGCYSVFEWQKDVEELESVLFHEHTHPNTLMDEDPDCDACAEPNAKWTRGKKQGIECRYFWDGDGILAFLLPEGGCLVNNDCKKDYGWYLLDSVHEL